MKSLLQKLRAFAKDGLFHIFGSSVLAQIGALISSMVVVRKLPKVEYGYYTGANNIYSYLAIFIGLGLTTAMLQYCSERLPREQKNGIYRFSLRTGMLFNLLLCVLILLLAFWQYRSGAVQTALYLALLCALPVVSYLCNYGQIVFRIIGKNRIFSYVNIVYTVTSVTGNIVLSILFGIPGLILSTYLGYAVAGGVYLVCLIRTGHFRSLQDHTALTPGFRKEYVSYASVSALTNFASTALVLLDVTCLNFVLKDPEILADYKVASAIPAACAFVPKSLMTYFYPKIVAAFSESRASGQALVGRLTKIYALVNGLVYLALALGAPLIIWILYGEKYMNTVPLFEILSVNFFLNSVHNLYGNVIAAVKKVKINLLLAVISGVLNIGLNLVLITSFGSPGAAAATVLVTLFITLLCVFYVRAFCRKAQ